MQRFGLERKQRGMREKKMNVNHFYFLLYLNDILWKNTKFLTQNHASIDIIYYFFFFFYILMHSLNQIYPLLDL